MRVASWALRPADLQRERVVQPIDQIADVIGDVAQMESVAAAIAGIENLLEVFRGGDDRFVVRQRAMAQVADAAYLGIRIDDPLGQDRQHSSLIRISVDRTSRLGKIRRHDIVFGHGGAKS